MPYTPTLKLCQCGFYLVNLQHHNIINHLIVTSFCTLRFNSINRITYSSFAELRKLELLLMHGNDVHQIPDGTFRDLVSLQVQIFPYEKTLILYFFMFALIPHICMEQLLQLININEFKCTVNENVI